MKKQLGICASLLLLCATALLWVGCSGNRSGNNSSMCCDQPCCPPVCCEQPCCQPACQPYCPPVSYQPCCPAPSPYQPCCPPSCAPACPPACQPACPPPPCRPVCRPVPPQNCRPVCPPQPCKPVCAPVCAPACEPMCKPLPRCCHPSSNELCCRDGISVTARNPNMCMLGDQYPLEFDVRACDDVCDATVTAHIPEGVTYIKSQPEGKVEGRKVTWAFGPMKKGECRPAKVWLKCECEGEQCACFCATATPVRFCSLLCAKPILTCEKCGPDEVCPGDPVQYVITVGNKGTCVAEDVVVTDNVPDGLEHGSCMRTLTYKLGSLQPCETKKVNLCFTACKRGKVCNTAVVSACNADTTSCQWCTCVCCCGIDLVKVGPKEQQIGKNADYQITVVNTGDKPLTEVVVTDVAPSSTSIVAANGATVCGNQAVWKLKEMKPGEKVSFTITLTTCVPGCHNNRVSVTNCQGCNKCAEFATRWKGRPTLNACITNSDSPICIGEPTSYSINVVNQGSEADTNVAVTVRFPSQITPVSASGDSNGTVSGQTVTFAPINTLGPRQTLRYRVDARAKESGDARIVLEVSSDNLKTPLTQQESTIVN
jgi:uncharacterized repeat protein (TIGR01451 family)